MPFVFGGCICFIHFLTTFLAFRFFSCTKNVTGSYLASLHVRNNASFAGENVYQVLIMTLLHHALPFANRNLKICRLSCAGNICICLCRGAHTWALGYMDHQEWLDVRGAFRGQPFRYGLHFRAVPPHGSGRRGMSPVIEALCLLRCVPRVSCSCRHAYRVPATNIGGGNN